MVCQTASIGVQSGGKCHVVDEDNGMESEGNEMGAVSNAPVSAHRMDRHPKVMALTMQVCFQSAIVSRLAIRRPNSARGAMRSFLRPYV
jgi:hypothetical protein